ncbi:hypothetical protein L5515_016476 [Caenorhabditis briggsae]|uniref:Uncharacterized protein n=1 Tax=Caenorhabditis briggsae TaxID=6238 RepID=A0AAE9FB90_CAEBR|nr:hypothetical protein L5515_016476 [Caenorhabditis briggsae]
MVQIFCIWTHHMCLPAAWNFRIGPKRGVSYTSSRSRNRSFEGMRLREQPSSEGGPDADALPALPKSRRVRSRLPSRPVAPWDAYAAIVPHTKEDSKKYYEARRAFQKTMMVAAPPRIAGDNKLPFIECLYDAGGGAIPQSVNQPLKAHQLYMDFEMFDDNAPTRAQIEPTTYAEVTSKWTSSIRFVPKIAELELKYQDLDDDFLKRLEKGFEQTNFDYGNQTVESKLKITQLEIVAKKYEALKKEVEDEKKNQAQPVNKDKEKLVFVLEKLVHQLETSNQSLKNVIDSCYEAICSNTKRSKDMSLMPPFHESDDSQKEIPSRLMLKLNHHGLEKQLKRTNTRKK